MVAGAPSGALAQTVGGQGGSAQGNAGGAGGGFDQPGAPGPSPQTGGGGGGASSTATPQFGGFGNFGGGQGGNGGVPGYSAGTFSSTTDYAGTDGSGGNNGFNVSTTNGSGGGGGGAGGYGAILNGTGAFGTTAQITGGTGGGAGYGTGGYGGYGYGGGGGGGGGGVGLYIQGNAAFTAGTAATGATITGGTGGTGGTSSSGVTGGTGGAGGAGVYSSSTQPFVNYGTITGGTGGAGGRSNTNPNVTTSTGGAGGDGGAGFFAAAGGTLTNYGGITGGRAGGGGLGQTLGADGAPGTAVVGSNLNVVNAGTINGGPPPLRSSIGQAIASVGGQGNAIVFNSGVNTLTLYSTSVINGNALAVAGGSDSLILGGATNGTFNTSDVGPGAQYRNFTIFQKVDGSTWTLTGAPTQATPWQVLGGTLAIASDASLGPASGGLLLNGGTLETTAGTTSSRAVTLGANGGTIQTDAGTFASSGTFGGPGGLTKTGAGTLQLSGQSSYTGPTLVSAGVLQAGAANAFSPNSAFTVNSTLDLGGYAQTLASLAGSGTVTNNGAATAAVTVGGSGASTAFTGTLVDGTSPLALVKTGAGTFSLSGVSTYSGGTRIKEGVLSINNGGALGSGSVLMDNGSTLAFTGSGYTFANPVQFSGLLDPTFDSGPGVVTMSGVISGGADLTKIGTGTLILSGASTYTGNTFVGQGTLQVDGSIASSPLTIVGSNAILSGIGTVGGITARQGSFVIPGNAANPYGVLSATGPVTLGGGSFLGISSSPTTASRLATSGTATIVNGGLVVSPGAAPYTTPVRLPILVASGGLTGQFTSVTYTSQVNGLQPTVVYDANDAYLQFGGTTANPPPGPNFDLQNSIAAADKLARQRFGEFATLRVLASVLQGFNQQINCSDCITGFGSGGSFSFGVQGRKALNDDFAVIGGVAYADYESGAVHVRSAPIIAGILRWDPSYFGSSRPFVDVGGFVAPSQDVSYGRAYAFGNMTGGGGASSNTTSTSAVFRLGWVSRLAPTDEIAVFGEIGRGWQSTGGYTESVLAPNPYPLLARRGEDRLNIAKGGAQYTHLWGTKIETQLNIGVAHAFDTESGLKGSTVGGTVLAPRIGDYTWAEYGLRLGYRISDNWVLDGFANGTLGPKPIGDTIHGGLGARYVF